MKWTLKYLPEAAKDFKNLAGIRVVYTLIRTESEMLVIVIGVRADDEVYEIAERRIQQNNL